MRIGQIRIETTDTGTRLSADVDGTTVWFQFRGHYALPNRVETVLASVLLPAMARREPLVVDPPASASALFLENLASYQAILSAWYPFLAAVPVHVAVRDTPAGPAFPSSAVCLFSGGVDSMHAFLENLDTISHALFVCGFDIQPGQRERLEQARQLNAKFVEGRCGKTLIEVETNVKQLMAQHGTGPFQGPPLVGIALGLGFSTTIVPASHTMLELAPWDSHPMTDPLLRTERCATVHYGPVRRSQKVAAIGRVPGALDDIRVCNASDLYNCGRCEKCLRTMVALELLGLPSKALPAFGPDQRALLRHMKVYDDSALTFWADNYALARTQNRPDLARLLGRKILSYQARGLARTIDAQVFGGRVFSTKRGWGSAH